MSFDITAILCLHREEYLCKPTISSINRAKFFAEKTGTKVEVVVVFDKSDELTLKFAKSILDPDWKVFLVDFGDPGAARNFAVTKSSGKLVAFLDGDDLWGENWLANCVAAAKRASKPVVWHPEVNIYFGLATHVFYHIDMESPEFDLLDLCFGNLWTALACAERDLLLEVPIPPTDHLNQIGHEDWGWNLQVIERGVIHKTVPGTGHAIRVKGIGSQNKKNQSLGVVPSPTSAFRRLLNRIEVL